MSVVFENFEKRLGFQSKIKWVSLFFILFFHMYAFYWCFHYAFPAKWQTIVFALLTTLFSGTGITCGVHRLWTHKCYKAKFPLRLYLMIAFSRTGQNSIYEWVRDHRLHHKFSDTEADPHNANRGFFFSHMGWLMMKKNNLVLEKGKLIDMSDILRDPIAVFEHKYSGRLSLITCVILPILTGMLLCGESWKCVVAWQFFIRVLSVFHAEMTVNSFAHMFGDKPYNKNIKPAQNIFVTTVSGGEGWHNYHHTFPNDYKASETFDVFNLATFLIRLWAKIGLAYDLKEPSPELVQAVINKQRDVNEQILSSVDDEAIRLIYSRGNHSPVNLDQKMRVKVHKVPTS